MQATRGRPARHHAVGYYCDPLRAPGLLAGAHAGHGLHLLGPGPSRLRRGRLRRRFPRPAGTGWPTGFGTWRLPLATLTLIGIGGTARFVRGAMLDVARRPHVAIARAKGLSPAQVTLPPRPAERAHSGADPAGPFAPGAVLRRRVHRGHLRLARVGRIMVEAVGARDYPVIMAATAVSAVLVVAGNLLAELLAAWADPRVRAAHSGAQ